MQMNAQADAQVAAPDVMALSPDEKPGNSRQAGDQYRSSAFATSDNASAGRFWWREDSEPR